MKLFLYTCAVLLLLLNGTGAVYGGWQLIAHPDGSGLSMTVEYLRYSPFKDYFIPGLVLFIANGLGSFAVLLAIALRYRRAAWLIMAQGAVLCGWIGIQLCMVRIVYYLHFVMGATGVLLLVCGALLYRIQKKKHS